METWRDTIKVCEGSARRPHNSVAYTCSTCPVCDTVILMLSADIKCHDLEARISEIALDKRRAQE